MTRRVLSLLGAFFFLTRASLCFAGPYEGPLFDAMTQWPNFKMSMDEIVAQARKAGVAKVAVFLRRPNHGHAEAAVLLAKQAKYPDLLVAGTPKYFRDDDAIDSREIKFLEADLKTGKYAFVSELMFRHFDKTEGAETEFGERMIDPFSKKIRKIMRVISRSSVPVMIHWELLDWDKDLPVFDKFFSEYPRRKFVIPHLGFGSPEQIDRILSRHPNVYVTISKRVFRVVSFKNPRDAKAEGPLLLTSDGKLLDAWREVLIKYQDRILFASDTYRNRVWKTYPESIQKYRQALGLLPSDVARKIGYENAEKLYSATK